VEKMKKKTQKEKFAEHRKSEKLRGKNAYGLPGAPNKDAEEKNTTNPPPKNLQRGKICPRKIQRLFTEGPKLPSRIIKT